MTTAVQEIIQALRRHKNVLLYGPPGTGKSHLMNEVARHFTVEDGVEAGATDIVIDTGEERVPLRERTVPSIPHRWVTFHQGYSYEDFILGMRPQPATGSGFSLVPRPGVLLELVAEAESNAGLLLIDEINRGNTSRIFGEFITLMEPGKRRDDSGEPTSTTVTLTLPYLAPDEKVQVTTTSGVVHQIDRLFSMPSQVYTLASMNSVDKSIAPLDTALRRRFHVINIFPSAADLRRAVELDPSDDAPLDYIGALTTNAGLARLAVQVMEKLNRGIGLYLGQDFMLGQWYLNGLKADAEPAASERLAETWLFRILPQLIELFHGRTELLITLLGLDGPIQGSGLSVHSPEPEEAEAGGIAFVTMAAPPPHAAEVIAFLQRFAGAPEAPAAAVAPAAPAPAATAT